MLNETTVTKLQEMHLSVMAKAFKEQLSDPGMKSLSFEDRFGLIVDQEWSNRKNNHLKRLIKNAGFAESGACVEDIEYHADRNLDKAQIARLAACNYITEHHNILLLGATGCGKTYLICLLPSDRIVQHFLHFIGTSAPIDMVVTFQFGRVPVVVLADLPECFLYRNLIFISVNSSLR
ncbi:MAG: ATP-binding protein [Clostridia bacterium]|nr:ATP-binding protein [Clostridia bacterium]